MAPGQPFLYEDRNDILPNILLHNVAVQFPHQRTGEPVFSRIPALLRSALNANAQERAMQSAGCELRFRLAGQRATLRLRAAEVGAREHGGGLAQGSGHPPSCGGDVADPVPDAS